MKIAEYKRWVNWCYVEREHGITKIPVGANKRFINVHNPKCQRTLREAMMNVMNNPNIFDGIGFVFNDEDPFIGIDLDNIHNWYGWQEIVTKINSYTELSPSGTGLHIIAEGFFPGDTNGRKVGSHEKGGIEMWDNGHYLTITLDVYNKMEVITKNQKGIEWLAKSMDDKGLINKILHTEYSKKFQLLWEGKWSGLGYPSQSEADLALCRILSNNHAPMHQIDRLFRLSNLFRPKWTEKRGNTTYGLITLEKALTED